MRALDRLFLLGLSNQLHKYRVGNLRKYIFCMKTNLSASFASFLFLIFCLNLRPDDGESTSPSVSRLSADAKFEGRFRVRSEAVLNVTEAVEGLLCAPSYFEFLRIAVWGRSGTLTEVSGEVLKSTDFETCLSNDRFDERDGRAVLGRKTGRCDGDLLGAVNGRLA